jgi:CRISPR-associated protein (TIGR02710 family)
MPVKTVLICTVGGSHQPIITAIKDIQPAHVYFICTGNDPGTGRPGSAIQIKGKGNCIKAHPADQKPGLPNIPAQAGLTDDQYTIYETLADDLDNIYAECKKAISHALTTFPECRLIADYTGGTKSMSAGLVVAALENKDIQLQLITGNRSDLIKVRDGFETAQYANIEKVRFERLIDPYLRSWERFAYSEAEAGLKRLDSPRSSELKSRLCLLRDLSRAYAEWDNFNHEDAWTILQNYAPQLSESQKKGLGNLLRLNDKNPEKRDAARLFDLYLNALRRAEQGRFDDAIARCYRLIEWSAQWLLEKQCGIKTADIQEEDIPDGVNLTQNRDGQCQAGLFAAWQLVKYKTDGAAAHFFQRQEQQLSNHLKLRNHSILAHGFEPIKKADWLKFQQWMDNEFIPALLSETKKSGIAELPVQLPKFYHNP